MNISLIAAISNNLVIGYKNKIPWYIPEDLKWFKKNTMHKTVIMGHLTWKTILKPLSKRKNIVISHNPIQEKGVIWVNSISNAIIESDHDKEIMVIGGSSLYHSMMFYANKLYLTHVDVCAIGDAYFPKYQIFPKWKVVFQKNVFKDHQNDYNYSFEILSR